MPGTLAQSKKSIFFASSGGVAANRSSRLSCLISFATNRPRYSGFSLSPLLVSTYLTPTGPLPVSSQHSSIGTFSYTPCFLNVSISDFSRCLYELF